MKDFIDRYGEEEGKSIYYATLTKMAKGESLWANIHKKRQRIKQGSGERMRKKGEKGAPTPAQMKRAKGESIDEINLPALIKSVIHRATHPKGYAKMLQAYIEMVKDQGDKHSNKFYAARVATMFGMNSVFPLVDYINKLVKKGMLPTSLMAQYEVDESIQLDEKIAGLVTKSKQTGVPYSILKKSYDRGMAAWKTGHRPGAGQQQWAFARVNSMLTGGKADPDLQAQIKKGGYKKKKKASKESVEEWFSSDETIKLYQERYGDEWLKKLNNTYEKMLSKLDEESCCEDCDNLYDHVIMEAEYQGKKVKLNDPIRTSENPKKKFKVYVKNEKGKVVVVRFGDPNMGINRDDPERRKAFRARHSCDDNPGPKWKARYWSCYQWRAGAKVDN